MPGGSLGPAHTIHLHSRRGAPTHALPFRFRPPVNLLHTQTMLAAASAIRTAVRSVEDWWFDTSRGVRTAGNVSFHETGDTVGQARDGEIYAPARVANARAALRALPIRDPSPYTFIDLGSGKGRMLFVAAELPFSRIIGVEFSASLHKKAVQNLTQFRFRKQGCKHIESVLSDAAEYEFPEGNLVLYLFNPFGADTIRRVLANLERSLQRSPRHVLILLLWPQNEHLFANMNFMRLVCATRRYQIYQTDPISRAMA